MLRRCAETRMRNLSMTAAALGAWMWMVGCTDDTAVSLEGGDSPAPSDAGVDATDEWSGELIRGTTLDPVSDGGTRDQLSDGAPDAGDALASEIATTDSGPSAPPTSRSCGDGIRDPVLEECDRGANVPARALCTADCRINDLLAVVDPPD